MQTYVAGGARATTLSSGINASVTSFSVVDVTGWPGSVPFVIVVDRGASTEEKMLVTARSGTSLTAVTRGYDSTSAVAHSVGTNNVEHCISALQIQEGIDHANDAVAGFEHTTAGIADNAITGPKIADNAVGTTEIADLAVTVGKLAGAITVDKLAATLVDRLFDIGDIKWRAHATAPSALWVVADGAEVSRGTYASAFALLGVAYGAGNGTTTFNLPNLVGASIEGVATNGARAQKAADSHSHTKAGTVTATQAAHGHTVAVAGNNFNVSTESIPVHTHSFAPGVQTGFPTIGYTVGPDGNHFHDLAGITTAVANEGSGHAHNANHGHTASTDSPTPAITVTDTISYAAQTVGSVTKLIPYIKIA